MTTPLGRSFFQDLRTESQPAGYPKNWNEISAAFRKKNKYICHDCGVCCETDPSLLDVHHKDHIKSHCAYENLQCLCKYHHATHHSHYGVNESDMQKLRQLWDEQEIPAEKCG